MTYEEAREFLRNKKVFVRDKSEEIQRKLFKFGFTWFSDCEDDKLVIKFTENTFIYINNFFLFSDSDINYFNNSKKKEITPEDILGLEIGVESELNDSGFKPYDKVLYKMNKRAVWMPSLVSYQDRNGDVFVISESIAVWKCIPYKDNEDKIGNK